MNRRLGAAAAIGALAAGVLGMNLFGRELNALFLRYPGIDKALHVVGYLIVYVVAYAIGGRLRLRGGLRAAGAAAVAIGLSLADEALQAVVPARSVEPFDIVANVAGVTLGWAIVRRRVDLLGGAAAAAALCVAAYVGWDTHVRLIDFSRAVRYEQQQDFVRAREHFQRALEKGLRTAGLFNELGWVEIESGIGDPRKAVEYAKTALELQPGNPDILDTYGWALHHAGRTNEAIAVLQDVYAARPNMFCIHYHLGSAYLAAGEREKARFHLEQQVTRHGTREAVFARQALERMGIDR